MSHMMYMQDLIGDWCDRSFGVEESRSVSQRGLRLLEESLEAAQSAGVSEEMAMKLVAYVFSRPVGEIRQEIGGTGLTLLALREAVGCFAEEQLEIELRRVLNKPIEHFRQRNQAKNDAGLRAVEG